MDTSTKKHTIKTAKGAKPGNKHTPLEWIPTKLNDVGSFSKGKGILKEQVKESGYPCIRYGEIYTTHDFFIKKFTSFIDDEVAAESKEIKNGDILFAGSGETIEEIGKSVAYLGTEKAFAGGDVIIFSPKKNVHPEFLSYALETEHARKQKRKLGQGNSVVHIYPSDLSSIELLLPEFSEQAIIADVLRTWHTAITTTTALITQKEQSKKWLMQQLLTGEKKLKGFQSTIWTLKNLSECLIYTPREVPKPNENFFALGLRSHGKGIFHKNDFEPEDLAMDVLYEVKKDDLVVNITFAWEHAIAIANQEDDGGLVSHRFPTYIFNRKNALPEFFKFFILQRHFKYLLDLISPGGAGRNRVMSKKDFLRLEVKIPSPEEQTAIAKVLQVADDEITMLKQKLEQLKEQKKGLMQVLLTGKKRLKV